jgi:methylenetetrahydrofolate--tRNA-(uracil-5-)-methyltransferase
VPPRTTSLGSLVAYVTAGERDEFQPMNANYGLFPPIGGRLRGRDKRVELGRRASVDLARWIESEEIHPPLAAGSEPRRALP